MSTQLEVEPTTYLGDSVYAGYDNGMLFICTENGGQPEDVIYLEPEVINAIIEFVS